MSNTRKVNGDIKPPRNAMVTLPISATGSKQTSVTGSAAETAKVLKQRLIFQEAQAQVETIETIVAVEIDPRQLLVLAFQVSGNGLIFHPCDIHLPVGQAIAGGEPLQQVRLAVGFQA